MSDCTIRVGEGFNVETFTFDKVFTPSSTQEELYNFIGKRTIDDVLKGYNGTIFAYGQTGSGKTHTMLGDVYQEESHGIIPRAAVHIFDAIENDEHETEYTLKCSLLEIYKETLRDLLEPGSDNLQIKECPRKGIYVKGLTEVCITTEKEFIDLLCLGQQLRAVASTKLNSTSSRSHFIFILEISQKLINDSEKKGILNLVDLAGSEKVNNSGVTGNNLEEAKKINLSLSALGMVINALIHNHDHIPYRDSKLTRLLQESLGGNFITTLLVTCSPAARSQSETIDSLKFAIRAKAIQNRARINLKNAPENYIKMIDLLKAELNLAKNEIKLLRSENAAGNSITNKLDKYQTKSPVKVQGKLEGKNEKKIEKKDERKDEKKDTLSVTKPPKMPSNRRTNSETIAKNPKLLLSKYPSITVEPDTSFLPTQEKAVDESIFSSFQSCKDHDYELEKLQETISSLRSDKEHLEERVLELEAKINSSSSKQLLLEQKSQEYCNSYFKSVNLVNKDATENHILKMQNASLQKQLKKLMASSEASEKRYKADLEEFKNFKESTILEFREDPENENYRSDVPVLTQQAEETKTISLSSFFISCDPSAIISPYSENLKKALEDPGFLNKDFTIYLLRQQLLQAAVANSELTSNISALN